MTTKTINDWMKYIHDWARRKGWWDTYMQVRALPGMPQIALNSDQIASKLMLVVSELSEALEEVRKPDAPLTSVLEVNGKPEGFAIELADAVIRIFDTAAAIGIDLDACIAIKMEYNETRPYKHGGKTI